jgi:serine phosphatase RsbU (regulator of sigma subunit)
MLTLRDITHLPELDVLVEKMLGEPGGVLLVAGWTPAQVSAEQAEHSLLPSGRSAVMWMLVNEYLAAYPQARAVIITPDRSAGRFPKGERRRIGVSQVSGNAPYPVLVEAAAQRHPDLLVVDELLPENAHAVFAAALGGQLVITQLNTLLRGAEVLHHLQDLHLDSPHTQGLRWVIAVERQMMLCPACRKADPASAVKLSFLQARYPHLKEVACELQVGLATEAGDSSPELAFQTSPGCPRCRHTGHSGEITVFDVYQAQTEQAVPGLPASLLSREAYMLHLAAAGQLDLQDILDQEADLRRRLYHMLAEREASLAESNTMLRKRLVELEASNIVLHQRTEQLISLESVSQMLIATDDLPELAARVCRRLESLCGADYVAFYHCQPVNEPPQQLELVATHGWHQGFIGRRVALEIFAAEFKTTDPHLLRGLPPAITPRDLDHGDGPALRDLRAGLSLPMIAQGRPVGMMVVQSTRKAEFSPGERALLKAFANQTAMAIQRAGLLQERIEKEKLENELELARRLQQSLLPHQYPVAAGFEFAALNQSARWVGGDFFDLFTLDDGQIGIVIGDASDKGIPAALYMALTRSLILAEARRSPSTAAVLRTVNQLLLELGELRGFITVFFGLLNPADRSLLYTRAGHDQPFLFRSGALLPLQGEGMLLGMLSDQDLRLAEERLELQPGDQLVLYTDGITDVVGPAGNLLGRREFQDILRSCLGSTSAASFCQDLFGRLRDFQGSAEQFDDMTVLVVRVL